MTPSLLTYSRIFLEPSRVPFDFKYPHCQFTTMFPGSLGLVRCPHRILRRPRYHPPFPVAFLCPLVPLMGPKALPSCPTIDPHAFPLSTLTQHCLALFSDIDGQYLLPCRLYSRWKSQSSTIQTLSVMPSPLWADDRTNQGICAWTICVSPARERPGSELGTRESLLTKIRTSDHVHELMASAKCNDDFAAAIVARRTHVHAFVYSRETTDAEDFSNLK